MTLRPEPVTSKFRKNYLNEIYPIKILRSQSYESLNESTESLVSILYRDSPINIDSDDKHTSESIKNKFGHDFTIDKYNPYGEKHCKRIIARQPDYPGSRTSQIGYEGRIQNNVKVCKNIPPKRKLARTVNNSTSSDSYENDVTDIISEIEVNDKCIVSNNDCSETSSIHSHKTTNSSVKSNNCIENESKLNNKKQNEEPKNAWEMWFMKKEKLRREKEIEKRKQEEEIKNNEIKKKNQKMEQEAKRQVKIKEWLQKKKEERIKINIQSKENEEKEKSKEMEKNKTKEKAKEKLDNWTKKKLEEKQRKEQIQEKENQNREAMQMIKNTKAKCAYNEWLSQNLKHRPPVPFSYGISDGKLTSYFDKTSNPPPSFFNPKPWISNID